MGRRDVGLSITAAEIAAAFSHSHWADRYPPVLTVDQAAELLRVPKSTLYAWSSQGRLKGCGRRVGKHLRLFRDRLLTHLFNGAFDNGEE
ncbi:MAG: helix-turn-helix domain-containing protein [Planctomycetaceae bacterium]|nr:helix-turn-helix domain-containing protein [Planctomycetaceae bacterium]